MNPGPAYKRRRPAVACTECRRRKIRCNRVRPCGPCSSRVWSAPRCVYNNGDNGDNGDNSGDTNDNENYDYDNYDYESRLYDGMENDTQNQDSFPFDFAPLHQDDAEAGFIGINRDNFGPDSSYAGSISGDLSTKNPSFCGGILTWTSMSSQDAGAGSSGSGPSSELQVEPDRNECENQWYDVFARCKALRFLIHGIARRRIHDTSVRLYPEHKAVQPLMYAFSRLESLVQHERERRAPTRTASWPTAPPSTPCTVRDLLPPRPVCDVLLDAYIDTFESVLRIIDVPPFLRNYEQFWADSTSRSEDPNEPFKCKLLVAIAIGSCTCFNLDVTLRKQAVGWIAYGQQWLTWQMVQRSCSDLDMAHIMCLLALARHTHHSHDGFSIDTAWLPGGHDLTRMGIEMGLHREPHIRSPGMTAREAEIRRRLWATMLELSLQLCFDQGLPAPIAPDSYDCDEPSNIPDEDINITLGLEQLDCPVQFTPSTLLVLLTRTQRLRLQILHLVNTPSASKTYEDSHQLAAEMNNACCADLDMLRSTSMPKPTNFQIKLLESFTRPFVLALHGPFADQAAGKPAYYYSRRVRLEVSTLLLAYPPLPVAETITKQHNTTISLTSKSPTGTGTTEEDPYASLLVYGHGHFTLVQRQATAALCMDLISELEENEFPTLDRATQHRLRDVLRSTVGVFERRMRASKGAHSAREFLFFSCADAYIATMLKHGHNRLRTRDADTAIAKAALTALAMCCELMV